MKISTVTLMLIFLVTLLSAEEKYMIIDKSGNQLTIEQLAETLKEKKVIFWGEYHGDAICHQLEIELLKALYSVNPKLIVSMEMFERDVQTYLDDYLSGSISEEVFLTSSRPWPNYARDYRPLVEFARINKLRIIAANVPRRYASMIAKTGVNALKELPDEEKEHVAQNLIVLDDEYKKNFFETITQSKFGNEENMAPAELLDKMYAAQCLKDDTMAESIVKVLTKQPDLLVIHYNGDFHSRKYLGTVQKLQMLAPELDLAVISPVYTNKGFSDKDNQILRIEGDFLLLINQDNK